MKRGVIAQPLDCCAVRPVNRKASYQWRLQEIIAADGLFDAADLKLLLAERGIALVGHVDRLAAAAARHGNEIIGPALDLPEDPDRAQAALGVSRT